MKVITLNTWQKRGPWEARWEGIYKGLEQEKPDLVLFQEIFDPQTVAEIKERLGFQTAVFEDNDSGLVICSHYPLQEWAAYTMQTQSQMESYKRFGLWAKLDVDGKSVSAFTTHLSWKLPDGETRAAQVRELLGWIEEKAKDHEVVVAGDFNAPPDKDEIKQISESGVYTDTFHKVHPDVPGYTWDNENNPYAARTKGELPDRRLDYLFVRAQGQLDQTLQSVEIIFTEPDANGDYPSDHFGVKAVFK